MSSPSATPKQAKYFAFLSYSHKEAQAAAALGRYIETFRVPVHLGGQERNLPKRMAPVFRDREEFAASADLGTAIRGALASSGALIVLCSPSAAGSRWVNEEIRTFRRVGDPKRIFVILLEGEPREAFPPALTEGNVEPLAVDFRRGGDNQQDARLRLVAALLGVGFDALKQRETLRVRNERLRVGAPLAAWQLLVALTIFYFQQELASKAVLGESWPFITLFGDAAIGVQLLAAFGLSFPRWPWLSGLLLAALISQALVVLEVWGTFARRGLAEGSAVFVLVLSVSFVLEVVVVPYIATLRDWLRELTIALRFRQTIYGYEGLVAVVLISFFALGGYAVHAAWACGFREYALPRGNEPHGIVTGFDGALWFTETRSDSDGQVYASSIGRITTSGKVTEYRLPPGSDAESIVRGSDGALWFSESDDIGRITGKGKITIYQLPARTGVLMIAAGSDGALWFTESSTDSIGRITTHGQITHYRLPRGAYDPWSITSGPDGALWFTEGQEIGRIDTRGRITEFPLPGNNGVLRIASGPDDALWYTDDNGPDVIGRLTTNGSVTKFVLPAGSGSPLAIVTGLDDALWFTEEPPGNEQGAKGYDEIGRITTSGKLTEYSLPDGDDAYAITTGPDGMLWFSDADGIGRL